MSQECFFHIVKNFQLAESSIQHGESGDEEEEAKERW